MDVKKYEPNKPTTQTQDEEVHEDCGTPECCGKYDTADITEE